MIPSEKVRRMLSALSTGFFLEPVFEDPDRQRIHLFVKAPQEIIRAVQCGAELFLWAGFVEVGLHRVPCSTVYIEDDPENGFYFSRSLGSGDVQKLEAFFEGSRCTIHFYDELDRMLLTAEASTSIDDVRSLAISELRDASFSDVVITGALDRLADRATEIPSFLRAVRLSINKVPEVFWIRPLGFHPPTYGGDRYSSTTVLGQEPGAKLEERITEILISIFRPHDISVSPWLIREQRELCDILVTTEDGLLLIETKATNVSRESLRRSTQRRHRNVEKQIRKALAQLQGALRRVKQPEVVESSKGGLLLFDFWLRRKPIHLAIVVSELTPHLHGFTQLWEDAIHTAETEEVAVHLLDVIEIANMCRNAGKAASFFHGLAQRWEMARQRQNLALLTRYSD